MTVGVAGRAGLLALLMVGTGLAAGRVRAAEGHLVGVNLSGLELNPGQLPGRANVDYAVPSEAELAAAEAHGFTVVRLPVAWERLQPKLGDALDPAMVATVRGVCDQARRHGLRVVLDVHGYGAWRGARIGSAGVPVSAFASLWGAIARRLDDPTIIYGLMNEPNGIDAAAWAADAQAAIEAIRAVGATNLVLVPGTGWDGAHNFVSGAGYGASNATALAGLHDPGKHMAFELHQYLDADGSGTHADCADPAAAAALVGPVTVWLRAHHAQGFLGEFAAAGTPDCLRSLGGLLQALRAAPDVWIGWSYWAAGPWWGDYMFSVEPKDGADRPQMAVLRAFAQPRAVVGRSATHLP